MRIRLLAPPSVDIKDLKSDTPDVLEFVPLVPRSRLISVGYTQAIGEGGRVANAIIFFDPVTGRFRIDNRETRETCEFDAVTKPKESTATGDQS